MQWLWSWLTPKNIPEEDREAIKQRETRLRDRYERLERLAAEVDVISRTDRPEGRPWAER